MPRRFQFSFRALFVAVLVVAAFFGGVNFGWRERDSIRRDIVHDNVVIKNLKKSNSELAQKLYRMRMGQSFPPRGMAPAPAQAGSPIAARPPVNALRPPPESAKLSE
jgi:hypothetical protein